MFKETNLLIVDDDPALVKVFEKLAKEKHWSFASAKTGTEAVELLNRQVFEAAVLDLKLPGYTGMQVLEYVKQNGIFTEIVMITGVGSIESAVEAIKIGAYSYLTKPFDDIDKVALILEKAMERHRLMLQIRSLERQTAAQFTYEGIIGRSRKIQEIFSIIDTIAGTNSTILITGESGTGKEMVARAIHNRSNRRQKPFVVINCAAIPEQLLESELFGHKRGSFTGAISDKRGLFEEAHGGTVFLDEVGEIPPSIQVKLLRILQEGEIRPVGDVSPRHVDVRIVAATNQDLVKAVKDAKFREDLYYRLNVINIFLPPLRERADDIPILTYHFLEKFSTKMGKEVNKISVDALQALQNYSWVGNVRELENVIERAVVLTTGDTICARDLPPRILGESFYLFKEEGGDLSQFDYREAKNRAMTAFNRAYLRNLLKQTSGNISVAAERAGMDRSNFKKLIKKYGIDASEVEAEGKWPPSKNSLGEQRKT
jgi:two-component system response regulator HydG